MTDTKAVINATDLGCSITGKDLEASIRPGNLGVCDRGF
jgi:hypothetical protein